MLAKDEIVQTIYDGLRARLITEDRDPKGDEVCIIYLLFYINELREYLARVLSPNEQKEKD